MSEPRNCSKCGHEVAGDKRLFSYAEITLKNEHEYIDDTVVPFYCVNCGYVELYREEEKHSSEASQ